jgi:hypothetical protein
LRVSSEGRPKLGRCPGRFGAVRQLPSGRWQARYTGPDGLRRLAPNTFDTKKAAYRWLVALEAEMLRGDWLDPMPAGYRWRITRIGGCASGN